MNVYELLAISPVELQSVVDKMSEIERYEMIDELSRVAVSAACFQAYIDKRYGYGCGDQGHKAAVKEMNKTGKKVWCDAMGFNAYTPITI